MANVHGKAGVKEQVSNARGDFVLSPDFEEFLLDPRLFATGNARFQFDAEHRTLLTPRADADQRGAKDFGMGIENRFAGDGEEGCLTGDDPVGFATAEPDTALLVPITEIAHTVSYNFV